MEVFEGEKGDKINPEPKLQVLERDVDSIIDQVAVFVILRVEIEKNVKHIINENDRVDH